MTKKRFIHYAFMIAAISSVLSTSAYVYGFENDLGRNNGPSTRNPSPLFMGNSTQERALPSSSDPSSEPIRERIKDQMPINSYLGNIESYTGVGGNTIYWRDPRDVNYYYNYYNPSFDPTFNTTIDPSFGPFIFFRNPLFLQYLRQQAIRRIIIENQIREQIIRNQIIRQQIERQIIQNQIKQHVIENQIREHLIRNYILRQQIEQQLIRNQIREQVMRNYVIRNQIERQMVQNQIRDQIIRAAILRNYFGSNEPQSPYLTPYMIDNNGRNGF